MASEILLASAIAGVDHLAAFDIMARKRFSSIQLDRLLVYIIDTVDASALPHLATQFDVLGYKGMRLATSESQQREVIKKAIEIKRHAGTPWAVEEALKAIGYPQAILIENAGTGQYGWAQFRIILNVGDNPITVEKLDELIKMINIYKNKRSHLIDLSYTIALSDDSFSLGDESNEGPSIDDGDSMYVGGDFRHNGEYLRDGEKNHSTDTDVLEIQIINV
jgi:phage tail P2-like protein